MKHIALALVVALLTSFAVNSTQHTRLNVAATYGVTLP